MSVPEGKMYLELNRHEVWLLASLLDDVMKPYPFNGQVLKDLNKPVLRKLHAYLEAVDGPSSHPLRPDSA